MRRMAYGLREWMRRLAGSVFRRRRDDDLERELLSHLELAAEDARAPGGIELSQAMDHLRQQRGLPWLEDFVRDVRHGLRGLRRARGFTAVTLMTLALGIGANAAVFSIVRGVILRPLAYSNPDQLMLLTVPSGTGLSYPEYA